MPPPGSVTALFTRFRDGDTAAADPLWERYFHRLQGLARKKLAERFRGAGHDEDVAVDAFASFCRAVRRGRVQDLADRDKLWALLAVIAGRKVLHLVRDEGRHSPPGQPRPPDDLEDGDLGPEFEAQAAEDCRRLMDLLGDDRLREVARLKLEGFGTGEIATRLGCSRRAVERKLVMIRTAWAGEVSQ